MWNLKKDEVQGAVSSVGTGNSDRRRQNPSSEEDGEVDGELEQGKGDEEWAGKEIRETLGVVHRQRPSIDDGGSWAARDGRGQMACPPLSRFLWKNEFRRSG